jgi:predicted HicB family RNase H-like nuclease
MAKRTGPRTPADEYSYRVFWYADDNCFYGAAEEFPSMSAAADSAEEALKEIKALVSDTLEHMTETGETPPEPLSRHRFSGKMVLRMPEGLHRRLAGEARREGVSLNQLINLKLTL